MQFCLQYLVVGNDITAAERDLFLLPACLGGLGVSISSKKELVLPKPPGMLLRLWLRQLKKTITLIWCSWRDCAFSQNWRLKVEEFETWKKSETILTKFAEHQQWAIFWKDILSYTSKWIKVLTNQLKQHDRPVPTFQLGCTSLHQGKQLAEETLLYIPFHDLRTGSLKGEVWGEMLNHAWS